MKKLIPAIVLLLVSAIVMSTASYAWFSMNTQVTATGMNVKAQAEGGIVISPTGKGSWAAEATASHHDLTALIPTSVNPTTIGTWYHASSNAADSHEHVGDYSSFIQGTSLADSTGVGEVTIGDEKKNIYVVNDFWIKSSGDPISGTSGNVLFINKVEAKVNSADPEKKLSASLRVIVCVDDQKFIYAPVSGATLEYTVGGTSTAVKPTDSSKSKVVNTPTDITAIGVKDSDAVNVKIYVYFEGEDKECKSSNLLEELENLTVSVTFGTTELATTATSTDTVAPTPDPDQPTA